MIFSASFMINLDAIQLVAVEEDFFAANRMTKWRRDEMGASAMSFPEDTQTPLLASGGEPRRRDAKDASSNLGKDAGSGPRVLFFGAFRELALYRAEVLRMSGFNVTIAETKEDVAAILKKGDLDVAVFSYTLPTTTVEELAELLREYCPDTPLITIANQRMRSIFSFSHTDDRIVTIRGPAKTMA